MNGGGDPDMRLERQLVDCLHMACSEQAAACEEDPDCIRLEARFQLCFTMREGNCINRCLQDTGIDRNSPTVQIHEPLFQCGRRAGCYDAQAGGEMNMNGPCGDSFENGRVLRNIPYADEDERNVLDLYLTTAPGPNPYLSGFMEGVGGPAAILGSNSDFWR